MGCNALRTRPVTGSTNRSESGFKKLMGCHFINEKLDSGLITTACIPSIHELADVQTKRSPRERFNLQARNYTYPLTILRGSFVDSL